MAEEKTRAPRNRTLVLTEAEQARYLARCRTPAETAACAAGSAVIHGDCFEALPLLPPGCADLLIADPPYNLDRTFGEGRFRKMDAAGYETFTRRWIEACRPALGAGASVYVCCDWRTSLIVGAVLGDYFTVRNRITWQREKGRGARSNWKNAQEDIWFATVSGDYVFHADAVKLRRRVLAPYRTDGRPRDWQETAEGRFRDTYPSNFWDDISVPYWSMPENTDHPTQKPEKLFAKLVLASSDPGGLVLDPFAGTGTACVVAKKLERRYLGIEREGVYCALAEKRLERAAADPSIQGYADRVFWERNSAPQRKKTGRQ